jgi:hypothetical protein
LLKYVDFIKDEHVKIQRFLSGIPSIFSDKIQYDDPKTLDEAIRRDPSASMINIEEDQLSKRLGKIRIKVRWSRGRRGTNHHSSEIILRDNQLQMSLE